MEVIIMISHDTKLEHAEQRPVASLFIANLLGSLSHQRRNSYE
jgi:hypothetical protein